MYFALSEVRLEEDQECKNYLRITPEYLDELFVRIKDDIAKMRDANTPKIKIVVKIYISSSLIYGVIFIIFSCGDLKFCLDVFHLTNFLN